MDWLARYLLCGLLPTVVLATGLVNASEDEEACGVLSLEWLVDSSDEVHRVKILVPGELPDPFGEISQPTLGRHLETLKAFHEDTVLSAADFSRFDTVRHGCRRGEEWLLFLRLDRRQQRQLVRGINLDRPGSYYNAAAITRKGQVLAERRAILEAVDARIKLQRRLSPFTNREVIDDLANRDPRSAHTTSARSFLVESFQPAADDDPFGGGTSYPPDPPISCWLGGRVIDISAHGLRAPNL